MDMLQRLVKSGYVWHDDYYVIGALRSAAPSCVMDVVFGHKDPRFVVDLSRS